MPLPTSGALSLGDIHVEAAGSGYAFASTSSLNDADIRGLTAASGYTINATPGTTISIGDFYGASDTPSSWTLTEGSYSISGAVSNGYASTVNTGSISPTTYNSATINSLYSYAISVKGSTTYTLFLIVNGNQSTSWFSSVSIAGVSHSQSSFNRSYDTNNNRTTWAKNISSHIFDGSGTTTVVFS